MPDEPAEPKHWTLAVMDRLERWGQWFWRVFGPLILIYVGALATRNTIKNNDIEDKVGQVQTTQQETKQETSDHAKEIKSTLNSRDAKLDKDAAEKKKDEEKQRAATESILYGNWKYLSENAVTPDDVKAADDAKKRYEAYANGKK